ncbi:MAG: hypothetical protein HC770_02850, partial [Pseudanabaena sp. CRU_2_10]|nr:hypothetical protein [Pseudanabaena sp. CRU_2_10]
MNITRVERDGVEFFTINATGESGMSESGLARLCGVTQQAISKLLQIRLQLILFRMSGNLIGKDFRLQLCSDLAAQLRG